MNKGKMKWIGLPLLLLLTMALATVTASAEAGPQEVNDWQGFKQAMSADGNAAVVLTGDVKQEEKIEIKGNKNLDLNGHTYDSGDRQRGFIVQGTLTIKDSSGDDSGRFIGGWEKGITVPAGARLNIHGGTFSTGSSSGYALLSIEPGGKCSMDGGVLSGNRYAAVLKEGENGGGVLELSGGAKIIKNGVGVYIENNVLKLADGDHYYYSSLVLNGGPVTIDQNGQNVFAVGQIFPGHPKECRPIQIKGDITGSRIGFQGDRRPIAMTNGYSEHNSAPAGTWFFPDDANQAIAMESKEIFLKDKADVCAETEAGTWTELAEAIGSAGESGTRTTIRLTKDIAPGSRDSQIAIGKGADVEIDLKGHTIDRGLTAVDDNGHIFVNGGALSLTSSVGTGKLTGGYAQEGGAIYNGGILSLNSVEIAGNKAEKAGGGIFNAANGSVSLLNCTVRGNEAGTAEDRGLGADIYNEGTLRMGDSRTGGGTSIKAGEIFLADETAIQFAGALNVPEKESDRIGVIPGIFEKQTEPGEDAVSIPFTMNYGLHNRENHPGDCFFIADEELAKDHRIAWDDTRKEVVLLDEFSGKIIVTYDPNGGGGDSYVFEDEDISYGKAYIRLNANTFDPPAEDKEFAGWLVGDELYQPDDLVCFDRDTVVKASWKNKPALTIVATSVDGTGDEAKGLPESMTVKGIETGTTIRDALKEANGEYKKEITDHFVGEGYTLARFLPAPLDAYRTWAEMPGNTDSSGFMSTAITEDTVIYAIMAKTLDAANLEIEVPACGTKVVKDESGNPSAAENAPRIFLPKTGDYEIEASENNPYSCYWSKGDRADTPFYGTIEGGAEYKVCIRLIPKAGLVFAEHPQIKVTGGTYLEEGISPWDALNQVLYVSLTVRASHGKMTEEKQVDATCTKDGHLAGWTCAVCGGHFKDAAGKEGIGPQDWLIPATGHTPKEKEPENKKEASCTEEGGYDLTVYCTTCKEILYQKHETIAPLGHKWEESVKNPDCESAGEKVFACKTCGAKKQPEIIPALGHDWSDWEIIIEPTPTTEGRAVRICKRCMKQDENEKEIPATTHQHHLVYIDPAEPTCTEPGNIGYWYCDKEDCRKRFEDRRGITELEESDTIIPANHKWNQGEVTAEPSCTLEGIRTYTCQAAGCGETRTEVIEPIGHAQGKPEEVKIQDASCTRPGYAYLSYRCKNCGESLTRVLKTYPASGHEWNEGKITREATAEAEGEKLYTCNVCGATKAEAIPKIGPAPSGDNSQQDGKVQPAAKKAQPMTVKAKTVKLKAKKLKKKKQTVARKKAMTIKNARGKLTFKKVKVNKKKYAKKFIVNKKTGKITVKKGVKKGLYKVTVKVRAAGNGTYKAGSKTVVVKIRVR